MKQWRERVDGGGGVRGENGGKSEERMDTNAFNSSCEPEVGVGVFT